MTHVPGLPPPSALVMDCFPAVLPRRPPSQRGREFCFWKDPCGSWLETLGLQRGRGKRRALFWAFLLIRDRGGVPGPGVEGGGGSLPALKMLCGTLHPDAGGPAAASGAGGMPIEALTWSLRARRLKAMLSGQSCPAVGGTGPTLPSLERIPVWLRSRAAAIPPHRPLLEKNNSETSGPKTATVLFSQDSGLGLRVG